MDDFAHKLLAWYDRARRVLPWRALPGLRTNPYHVLVSELMLQQTQVDTVVPYFHRFIERFPHIRSLAAADEQDVLRLWQGLGYYSRARNLHRAAGIIVNEHCGRVPSSVNELRALPGIGEYTAGAIASLGYEQPEPILDGNVARVICRIDCVEGDPRLPAIRKSLWQRSRELLPNERVGDFNTALMELGALVCTPRNPSCLLCPVASHCLALTAGRQNQIPVRLKSKIRPLHSRWTFVVRREQQYLIQQRPPSGRWASLWQFPTYQSTGRPPKLIDSCKLLEAAVSKLSPLCEVSHALTHRRYHFMAYRAAVEFAPTSGVWVSAGELCRYPMSKPQLHIARCAFQQDQ